MKPIPVGWIPPGRTDTCEVCGQTHWPSSGDRKEICFCAYCGEWMCFTCHGKHVCPAKHDPTEQQMVDLIIT